VCGSLLRSQIFDVPHFLYNGTILSTSTLQTKNDVGLRHAVPNWHWWQVTKNNDEAHFSEVAAVVVVVVVVTAVVVVVVIDFASTPDASDAGETLLHCDINVSKSCNFHRRLLAGFSKADGTPSSMHIRKMDRDTAANKFPSLTSRC